MNKRPRLRSHCVVAVGLSSVASVIGCSPLAPVGNDYKAASIAAPGGSAGSAIDSGGSGMGGAANSSAGNAGTSGTIGAAGAGSGGTGGITGAAGASGTSGAGGGGTPPSCVGLAATCGPNGNADCCASSVVPGGTFYRTFDGDGVTTQDADFDPATVSDFRLDTYEVTVGRFRKFVAAYSPDMIPAGAGANPNNPLDTGWDSGWNADMQANPAAVATAVQCEPTYQTWTDSAGTAAAESLPIDCLDWYLADAFCIWDGGRLPTEAEWGYTAAGGSEQRVYPWSNPPTDTTIDATYAVYTGSTAQVVGSRSPKGDGKWGQADLGGNAYEWVEDWYGVYSSPCDNCAELTPLTSTGAASRMMRGGSFGAMSMFLLSANRNEFASYYITPVSDNNNFGVRCAR
jgi:sulfatase modifying factor 1